MAISNQINKVNCGQGGVSGTGHEACSFDFQRVKTIELSKRSFVYSVDSTLASIKEAQQKEDIFIISDMDSCKLIPVEPTMSTAAGSGAKSVDGELPYEFEIMFKKQGINFWKALRKFNSSGVYNVAYYDINGNKMMTQSKSGLIKGFTTNMIHTGQYVGQEGDAPAIFKMTIQEDDVYEKDRAVWISGDSVDYGVGDLDGYNDVILTASPLATAGTTLTVKATLSDLTHFAGGLTTADFLVKKDGVVVTHTGVVADESNMNYAIEIPAASAGTYTVETKNTYGKGVVLQTVTGLLLKSNVATVLVS